MYITALIIGTERYIWIYGDSRADKTAVIQSAARMADDPQLSIEWHGAALVAAKVREKQNTERNNEHDHSYRLGH